MFVLAARAHAARRAFPIALFVGLTSVAFITASTAIVQVRADPAMRGRVLALQGMVLIGSTPIGGPLLGWICDAYGARAGIAARRGRRGRAPASGATSCTGGSWSPAPSTPTERWSRPA